MELGFLGTTVLLTTSDSDKLSFCIVVDEKNVNRSLKASEKVANLRCPMYW